jgi:hypothetical protein
VGIAPSRLRVLGARTGIQGMWLSHLLLRDIIKAVDNFTPGLLIKLNIKVPSGLWKKELKP